MTTRNFYAELENIVNNTHITQYFIEHDVSVEQFLMRYIAVDEFIRTSNTDSDRALVSSKLDTLRHQIEGLSNDSIKQDLLKMFNDNFSTLVHQLSSHNVAIDKFSNVVSKDFDNMKLYIDNAMQTHLTSNDQKTFSHIMDVIKSLSVTDKLNSIHDLLKSLHTNLTSNSNVKGAISETILFNKLTAEFPDADIVDSSKTPHSGDFVLNRLDAPKVLIDIKNYTRNVPKEEIDKFYDDLRTQQCSGILCSVKSGVACKRHFEVEIIDDKFIAVFVHNFNFDPFFIRLAANVIDHMDKIVRNANNTDNVTLSRSFFSSMKSEYDAFLQVFHKHIASIQSTLSVMSNMQLDLIDQFFSSKTSCAPKGAALTKSFCGSCQKYFKNKFSLERHLKSKHGGPQLENSRELSEHAEGLSEHAGGLSEHADGFSGQAGYLN